MQHSGSALFANYPFRGLQTTVGKSNYDRNILFIYCFQHLHEILDLNKNALDWMMEQFPDIKEREEMRKIIGRYGLSGQQQVSFLLY